MARRYTLMLVPERGGAARTYKVSSRTIRLVVGLVLVVAVVAGAVGIHQAWLVTRLRAEATANLALGEDNTALLARVDAVEKRLGEASEKLRGIATLDDRIRSMTMLSDPSRHLEIGPLPDPSPTKPDGAKAAHAAGLSRADERPLLLERLGLLDLSGAVLAEESAARARSLEELVRYFGTRESMLQATPSVWPVRGYVTSNFGSRVDELTGERRMHPGLDISTPIGTPVRATADARVAFAGEDEGYGKVVELDHGRGLTTKYAHLSGFKVTSGAVVKRGDVVALTGNTGRSTGPHLHYEVRLFGVPENPRRYLLE